MATVFVHWVGKLKGDVDSPLHDTEQDIDRWVPEEKPEGATHVATDTFDDEIEVFHGAYKAKTNIGPFKATLGVNIKFKGTVDYWKK